MKTLKYLATALLAFTISGCGQDVATTLYNPVGANPNGPGYGRSIVVLPFADYSSGGLESAQRRAMMISESFVDNFNGYGFSMPVGEDVFGYLVNEKLIKLVEGDAVNTKSLDVELNNGDWSPMMRGEIARYKKEVIDNSVQDGSSAPGVHALTAAKVAKLGRYFSADYVVRGRILEFKTRDEAVWAPWKQGVLPFYLGTANRVLNGVASSEKYDARNEGLTGALLGGVVSHNKTADWPWDTDESIFGMVDGTANTITWSAIGYGVGHSVTHDAAKVEQAVVQMRVWVQDANSGNVVWTNRIRVAVAPQSVMSDHQYDALFNSAIEKAASTLSTNFVSYGL